MTAITDVLQHPAIYQAFQVLGGFYQARLKALGMYLPMQAGQTVIDIGCGPGFIVDDLPKGLDYRGFDTNERYIAYAKRQFGNRGQFFCREFNSSAAQEVGPVDCVMMNGVLHHLGDADVRANLRSIREALRPGGRLFTLDGCFVDGQSPVANYLLRNDRGQYVRNREGYESLLREQFGLVETHIEDSLSRLPYTFIVTICSAPS